MLGSKLAVLGRASEVDYKFDDGKYFEKGRPKGVDVGARYYPAGGMEGFFISGTVGYWTADWTFTDNKGRSDEFQGKGNSDSIRANVDIGGRFPIGSSSVSIMPALNVGKFFSSTSCEYTGPASLVGTECSQKSEVEYYIFLAVTAGIRF
jgi:outer membrane autotransporter protein